MKRIGCGKPAAFIQGDAYGQTVRGALDVEPAVERLAASEADVIFMAGAAGASAEFVAKMRERGSQARFATISFVGAAAFARAAGADGRGVVVSQVTPPPNDRQSDLARRFQASARRHGGADADDPQVLEGCVLGLVVGQMVERAGVDLRREGLLDLFAKDRLDLPIEDFRLRFEPGRNQGSDAVYLVELTSAGSFSPL